MVWGKGDKIEAFLHVEDMCRAVIHAFDQDSMIGEAYNVADDTHIPTSEFYNLVNRELFGQEKDHHHRQDAEQDADLDRHVMLLGL